MTAENLPLAEGPKSSYQSNLCGAAAVDARAPASSEVLELPDLISISDGWDAFSSKCLNRVLYGFGDLVPKKIKRKVIARTSKDYGQMVESEEMRHSVLTGYCNYRKALNLKNQLNMELPDLSTLQDIDPQQFLIDYHKRKLDYYEDKTFLFCDKKTNELFEGNLICRGMPQYQAKTRDVFDDLSDYIAENNIPTVLGTFSLWTPEGTSPLDTLVKVKGLTNRLISFITTTKVHRAARDYRRALERKGVKEDLIEEKVRAKMPGWYKMHRPEYVWAIEPTKRGYAHLHILFVGMHYLIPKEDLVRWWRKNRLGDDPGVNIEEVKGQENYGRQVRDPEEARRLANKYVVAYVGKPNQDPRWAGLLSLTRKREWGMSNTLRAKVASWQEERIIQAQGESSRSLGLTNSNTDSRFEAIGIVTALEKEILLSSKWTSPEDLRQILGEIRGAVASWEAGKWHRGEGS